MSKLIGMVWRFARHGRTCLALQLTSGRRAALSMMESSIRNKTEILARGIGYVITHDPGSQSAIDGKSRGTFSTGAT